MQIYILDCIIKNTNLKDNQNASYISDCTIRQIYIPNYIIHNTNLEQNSEYNMHLRLYNF